MTKRGIIAIVAATVLVIAAVSWYSFRPVATYHAKTVQTLSRQLFNGSAPAKTEATEAFHSLGSNAVPALIAQLHARDSILRRLAWGSVGHVNYRIAKWIRASINPPDANARKVEAADALGEIGEPAVAAVPELARSLAEGPNMVRLTAATALGRIGDAGKPALLAALRSSDPMLRRAAITGIAAEPSANGEMARVLFNTLDDEKDYVRAAAAAGIAARGPELLREIIAFTRSTDPHRRLRATQALTMFRLPRQVVVPILVELCADQDDTCRLQAVKTLAMFQLPNPWILGTLCAALRDPLPEIRSAAANGLSLARFMVPMVLPELVAALKDTSPSVRETSAAGLGRLGKAAVVALPQLLQASADNDARVRVAASNSIVSIETAVEDAR